MNKKIYPHFLIELMKLGSNDKERAAALGVSYKSISRYRDDLPEAIERLMSHPQLIKALWLDAQSDTENPHQY